MKIWIIDHYSSEPQYGGISRQFDFAKGLSMDGHEVVVISSAFSHFSHSYITDDEYLINEINPHAHYVYLKTLQYKSNKSPNRIFNMFSFVSAVKKKRKLIEQRFGKPDIVVGCSIHPFTWIAANKVAKKNKAKLFVEVRDLWPATWIYNRGMSKYHPMAIFFGKLEKWAYKKADKIIYSMSRGDKYICDIVGIPREKVCWIDQPMDCERFDNNAKRFDELPDEIKKFIGDSFLCVFTGYYMEYEGVNEMLAAAEILKNKGLPIKFIFVGSGKEEEKMRDFAARNHLNNVLIGGRIGKELVPALLRRAQICLVHLAIKGNRDSWKFDASKNKINEYMYSDSCVIYGTYIENQFVKTSGAGYTIEPFNADAFADTIECVYRMPEDVRKKFGCNARKHVLDNNTLPKLVQKYEKLFEVET